VSCTSADFAAPMPRWFVTTSPLGSTRNPDACVAGVQMPTTLFRHCCTRNPLSDSGAAPGAASDGPSSVTSALAAVSSMTVSRPAAMSTICIHW
jgi:hypothetical protein